MQSFKMIFSFLHFRIETQNGSFPNAIRSLLRQKLCQQKLSKRSSWMIHLSLLNSIIFKVKWRKKRKINFEPAVIKLKAAINQQYLKFPTQSLYLKKAERTESDANLGISILLGFKFSYSSTYACFQVLKGLTFSALLFHIIQALNFNFNSGWKGDRVPKYYGQHLDAILS